MYRWSQLTLTRRATAVAGYDLTFSPVKSVSTLWAVAPRAVSQQIEAAHHAVSQQIEAAHHAAIGDTDAPHPHAACRPQNPCSQRR